MLSYRHAFHAGNFADVHKHVILTLLLTALARKAKPFFVLDTHAGAGEYDLESPEATKNREFEGGIERILAGSADAPVAIAPYLEAVARAGEGRCYPGSPRLVRERLRPGDRLVVCEMHPRDHERLRARFADDR